MGTGLSDTQPLWEIALGGGLIVISLLLHGTGMYVVQRRFARAFPRDSGPPIFRQVLFGMLIAMMLVTHLAQVLLWTAALVAIDAIASLREAFYYVAVTYTTLGYEETLLPMRWRLLAPSMAISGVFAFGWTTGVLVSIVTQANLAYASGNPRPPA